MDIEFNGPDDFLRVHGDLTEALAVMQELEALKGWHDEPEPPLIPHDHHWEWEQKQKIYATRKPLAWAELRRILAKHGKGGE